LGHAESSEEKLDFLTSDGAKSHILLSTTFQLSQKDLGPYSVMLNNLEAKLADHSSNELEPHILKVHVRQFESNSAEALDRLKSLD
jgi:hypothetical protein